jgi:hypothetical protein
MRRLILFSLVFFLFFITYARAVTDTFGDTSGQDNNMINNV